MTDAEFSSSTYEKKYIIDDENGQAIWGHADFGQMFKESCIWIKLNGEATYRCYIIESEITLGNNEDMENLKEACIALMNYSVSTNS
ncbi:MAG: hypothetical protein MJZ32_02775 [Bacteroidaceae bacterium]|nr:hypothetical protein [Bacteroidaceae bacterium]